MTGLVLINQPRMAATKKSPAATRNKGPIQEASLSARVLRTDELEKENTKPKPTQLIIGKLIQAGTFDSRDFCTKGFEIMCSRMLTVKRS
jgi:hypothetical protein